MTDTSGRQVTSTTCGDSYAADVFRPVADPDSRHLISPSGCVSQTSVGRILEGGGLLGSVSTANRFDSGLAEVTFEIHLIVFVDGEIAGPDPNKAENVPPNLLPNEFEWPRPKAAMSLLFLPLSLRHPPSALSEALSATHSSTQSNITPVNICGTCTAKSATLTWPKPRYVASRIDQRFLNSIVTHYRPPNKMQSLISVRFRVL